VVGGLEGALVEPLREAAGVDAVALGAGGARAVLARVADEDVVGERGQEVVESVGLGALLEGDVDLAAEAADVVAQDAGLGLKRGLGDEVAAAVADGDDGGCGVHVQADILAGRRHRALLSAARNRVVTRSRLLPRGALL
jgi:hypothetical protein